MSDWEKQALSDLDHYAGKVQLLQPDSDEPINSRQSHVINRAYVRQWALEYAKDKRPFVGFTRVSEEFLNAVESATKAFIRDRIERHPTKGRTLK